jgi:putative transposase
MTMGHDILKQMPGLGQPQRKFLAPLCITILVLRGRVHCRTLSRSCDDAERPMARQCREPFDWPALHQRVLRTALAPRAARVAAPDASFLPQRGKQTCGLGHFFNGRAHRAARGLAIATLAVVEVTHRGALTRAVAQTPPGENTTQAEPEDPRVDFSTQPRRAHRHRLPPRIPSPCVAGDDAKKNDLAEVVRLALHASTKRRSDADGWFLSPGPHPPRRGARRTYAGKVTCHVLSRFEDLGTRAEAPHLHRSTAVVWPKTLPRRVRLVVLLHRQDPAKPRCIVVGSTDPDLKGQKLLDRYAARCQSAFLFRDRTQCTGLLDGQARAASA